ARVGCRRMAEDQATAPPGVSDGSSRPPTPGGSAGPVVDDPRDARLVLAGTVALLVTLPMPWYRTDVPGHEVHARGWQGAGFGFTLVAALAALSLAAVVLGR